MLRQVPSSVALLVVAGAACGPSVGPAAPAPPEAPRAVAQRPHVVQPYELILRGAPPSGVRRAILGAHGEAWLRPDGEPHASPGWHDVGDAPVVVAETRDDLVRILHEADDARLLVWIARDDLRAVIVREVVLDGADASGPRVVVSAGTPYLAHSTEDGRSRIRVEADGLVAAGWIPIDAVGDVWDATPPPSKAGPTRMIFEGTDLRAAPDAAAPVLATTTTLVGARALGPAFRGWIEVETLGAQVRARGFVPEAATTTDELGLVSGGIGGGYGMSHTMRIDVAAGTCLYDDVDGEVIGIVTRGRNRYVGRIDGDWWRVIVDSPWGLLGVPARGRGEGPDLEWEQCVDPAVLSGP